MLTTLRLASLTLVLLVPAIVSRQPDWSSGAAVGAVDGGDTWYRRTQPDSDETEEADRRDEDGDDQTSRGVVLLGEIVDEIKRNAQQSAGGNRERAMQQLKRQGNRKFQTQGWRRKKRDVIDQQHQLQQQSFSHDDILYKLIRQSAGSDEDRPAF